MQHLKTFTFNTDDKSRAVLEHSNIHHIRRKQCGVWCDVIHIISRIFYDAQLAHHYGVKHYRATLVIEDGGRVDDSFKDQDSYTSWDFMKFVIRAMQPPTGSMTLSVYINHNSFTGRSDLPWHTNVMWPLKDKNEPSDPPYVTFQMHEQNLVDARSRTGGHCPGHTDSVMKSALEALDIDYKIIDYRMPPELAYKLIKNSSLHVSYVGASYWLAIALETPILQYGLLIEENKEHLLHKGRHGATRGGKHDKFLVYEDGDYVDTIQYAAGGSHHTGLFESPYPTKTHYAKKLVDIMNLNGDK